MELDLEGVDGGRVKVRWEWDCGIGGYEGGMGWKWKWEEGLGKTMADSIAAALLPSPNMHIKIQFPPMSYQVQWPMAVLSHSTHSQVRFSCLVSFYFFCLAPMSMFRIN